MENDSDNGLYIDYVKIDTIYTDENAKRRTVPMILLLDSSVISVSVVNIYSNIARVLIYKGEGDDLEFEVETNKLGETFEAIYDVLKNLWDNDEDNDVSNID